MPTAFAQGAGWAQLYREMRAQIRQGEIAPGAPLPTIAQLSNTHGLTRHGARRVLEKLRDEGLVSSWQGKGYRVSVARIAIRMNHNRPVFHENVARAGRLSTSHLASAKQVGLPLHIARRMNERPGQRALYTETLRKVDDEVSALSVDYFAPDRFETLSEAIAQSGSISHALEAHGISHYRRDVTSISSRLPTAHEAVLLGIPRNQPVYETVGGNLDKRGRIFQVSTAIWRGDRVVFET